MTASSRKQTLILGLSGSLNGGAAYSYIVSLGYFTPAVGIIAGLIGGFGVGTRYLFREETVTHGEDIPLKDIVLHVLFGITALFLGYVLVYYFVALPSVHGGFIRPSEQGTIYDFFKQTMGLPDIVGATLGSISSIAIPILFKGKIRNLMKKLQINPLYSASK